MACSYDGYWWFYKELDCAVKINSKQAILLSKGTTIYPHNSKIECKYIVNIRRWDTWNSKGPWDNAEIGI
jgi:hypothetical protein